MYNVFFQSYNNDMPMSWEEQNTDMK